MGCATATIKLLVFVFNTLCALIGLATIVINAIALKNVTDEAHTLCILLIVIGSIVFIISFFGCCGAIKENVCMTWIYATFMLILLVGSCVLVFVYLQRINFEKIAHKTLNETWSAELNGTDAMKPYQENLHCCGYNSTQDYPKANLSIPQSCYATNSTNSTNVTYSVGCFNPLVEKLQEGVHLVRVFGFTSIGVEGVAFLSACILAVTFNNQARRSRY